MCIQAHLIASCVIHNLHDWKKKDKKIHCVPIVHVINKAATKGEKRREKNSHCATTLSAIDKPQDQWRPKKCFTMTKKIVMTEGGGVQNSDNRFTVH